MKKIKKVIEISVVVLLGTGLGLLLNQYLLSQPWWPVSVSGEPETVAVGKLAKNDEAKFIGLKLETETGGVQLDMNRFSAKTINNLMGKTVTVRGVERESGGEKFIEASWIKRL
ncbi:MAG: hypothetical protein HY567_00360 [Candidatus Kerfeldbacteria bacterium]|nr:hypothetical protein [Candidatus Kerfeldbacteria bacterium]